MSYEERLKKKKMREDDYLKKFKPEERPVLLIKEKHNFLNANKKDIFDQEDKESYYKITKNTQVIQEMENELETDRKKSRKHTLVHFNKKKPIQKDQKKQEGIIKIEGTEYLPKGFLELDPLLMKDEYDFENSEDEKLFREEQRKIVALRRKQYLQRKNKKKREVVILLLDEKINFIQNELDQWYYHHRRKMNAAERALISKKVYLSEEILKKLENLFLYQNGYWDYEQCKAYLTEYGQMIDGEFTLADDDKLELIEEIEGEVGENEVEVKEIEKEVIQKFQQKSSLKKSTPLTHQEMMEKRKIEQFLNLESNNEYEKPLNTQNIQIQANKESFREEMVQIKKFSKPIKESVKIKIRESQDESSYQRVTLVQHNSEGVIRMTQLLTPAIIFGRIYYQTIESIEVRGETKHLLITSSEDGSILSAKNIPNHLQAEHYHNVIVQDSPFLANPMSFKLIVINSKGHFVSAEVIIPGEQVLMCEEFYQKQVLRQNLNNAVVRVNDKGSFRERIYFLQPVRIYGRIFQQKILQKIEGDFPILTQILTMDENGYILFKDLLEGEDSDNFYSTANIHWTSKNGEQFTILETKNNDGMTLCYHAISNLLKGKILRSHTLAYDHIKKSTLLKTQKTERTATIYLKPVFCGNIFFYQTIKRVMGLESDQIIIETRNQYGEIVNTNQSAYKEIDSDFSSVIAEETVDQCGKLNLLILTQNKQERILSACRVSQKFPEQEILLENYHSNVVRYVLNQFQIRNQFYYQILEIQEEDKAFLSTKRGERTIERKQIDFERIKGTKFKTLIKEQKIEDDPIYVIETLDFEGDVLAITEITLPNSETIHKEIWQDFKEASEGKDYTVITYKNSHLYLYKPYMADQIIYQIGLFKIQKQFQEDWIGVIYNQYGDIVGIDLVDNNFDWENLFYDFQKTGEKSFFLGLIESNGNKVFGQKIQHDLSQQLNWKDFLFQNVSKLILHKKEDNQHNMYLLKPIFIQDQIIQQVIKRPERGKIMEILTLNKKREILKKVKISNENQSISYRTRLATFLINDDNNLKITLETIDEKNRILISMDMVLPRVSHQREIYLDGELEDSYIGSKQEIQELSEGFVKINKLTPIFIGDGYFHHQVIQSENQEGKSVELVTYDKYDEEINREELDLVFFEDHNFRVIVESLEPYEGALKVTLLILNHEDKIISQQQFVSIFTPDLNKYLLSDFFSILDSQNNKICSVAIKQLEDKFYRIHSLNPLLLGFEYYTFKINELISQENQNIGQILLFDQNGNLVLQKTVDQEYISQSYKSKIFRDIVNKEGRREITFGIVNEKNQKILIEKYEFNEKISKKYSGELLIEYLNQDGSIDIYTNKMHPYQVEQINRNVKLKLKGGKSRFQELLDIYRIQKIQNQLPQLPETQRAKTVNYYTKRVSRFSIEEKQLAIQQDVQELPKEENKSNFLREKYLEQINQENQKMGEDIEELESEIKKIRSEKVMLLEEKRKELEEEEEELERVRREIEEKKKFLEEQKLLTDQESQKLNQDSQNIKRLKEIEEERKRREIERIREEQDKLDQLLNEKNEDIKNEISQIEEQKLKLEKLHKQQKEYEEEKRRIREKKEGLTNTQEVQLENLKKEEEELREKEELMRGQVDILNERLRRQKDKFWELENQQKNLEREIEEKERQFNQQEEMMKQKQQMMERDMQEKEKRRIENEKRRVDQLLREQENNWQIEKERIEREKRLKMEELEMEKKIIEEQKKDENYKKEEIERLQRQKLENEQKLKQLREEQLKLQQNNQQEQIELMKEQQLIENLIREEEFKREQLQRDIDYQKKLNQQKLIEEKEKTRKKEQELNQTIEGKKRLEEKEKSLRREMQEQLDNLKQEQKNHQEMIDREQTRMMEIKMQHEENLRIEKERLEEIKRNFGQEIKILENQLERLVNEESLKIQEDQIKMKEDMRQKRKELEKKIEQEKENLRREQERSKQLMEEQRREFNENLNVQKIRIKEEKLLQKMIQDEHKDLLKMQQNQHERVHSQSHQLVTIKNKKIVKNNTFQVKFPQDLNQEIKEMREQNRALGQVMEEKERRRQERESQLRDLRDQVERERQALNEIRRNNEVKRLQTEAQIHEQRMILEREKRELQMAQLKLKEDLQYQNNLQKQNNFLENQKLIDQISYQKSLLAQREEEIKEKEKRNQLYLSVNEQRLKELKKMEQQRLLEERILRDKKMEIDQKIQKMRKFQNKNSEFLEIQKLLQKFLPNSSQEQRKEVSNQIFQSIDKRKKSVKEVMFDFENFCSQRLPNDKKFKNSILLLSLFYFFLKKKNLLHSKI